jgi:hypothetical protein
MRREIVKFRRSIVKFSDEAVKISVRSSDSDRSRQIHSKIVKTTFLDNLTGATGRRRGEAGKS